jgi:hyperosmotically inducible periplasmic protein
MANDFLSVFRAFLLITGTFVILASFTGCENSATAPSTNPTAEVNPDPDATSPTNSAINERDREETAKTPIDQGNSQHDIDITAEIRKKIVATEMSTNAHNVKIITQGGKVTLRGPVDSEDEKSQIEKIAHDVAGKDQVENLIEVVRK